jgi:hypothetical protein
MLRDTDRIEEVPPVTIHREGLSDFRILVHPSSGGDEQRRDASSLPEVAVARGVSSLDIESLASDPQPSTVRPGDGRSARALHFEPLSVAGKASLLMLIPFGVEVRVNDLPSPRVAVLGVGDQLRVGETLLHVTRFREFSVGPPTPELLGRRCGVCRVPFDESTLVYVHDCGAAMHLEPDSKPADKRLQCAPLGDCPNCEQPIVIQSGYSYTPEI